MGQIHKENMVNEDHAAEALKDSLFLIDREEQLSKFVKVIQEAYKTKAKKLVLIKGPTGSGKSLFLRRGFFEFLNNNKKFSESIFKTEKKRILFCTYQTPISLKKPFNGFYKIFREMFQYLFLNFDEKVNIKSFKNTNQNNNFGRENVELNKNKDNQAPSYATSSTIKEFNEQIISIIIEENCFYLIKYLELILKVDLIGMFERKFNKAAASYKEESENENTSTNNNNINNNLNNVNNFSNSFKNNEQQDAEVLNYTPENLYTFNRSKLNFFNFYFD